MTPKWKEEFDKEFVFTGIEHQLEGLALSEDLKAFMEFKFKELIDESTEGIPYNPAKYEQLKAKWLSEK